MPQNDTLCDQWHQFSVSCPCYSINLTIVMGSVGINHLSQKESLCPNSMWWCMVRPSVCVWTCDWSNSVICGSRFSSVNFVKLLCRQLIHQRDDWIVYKWPTIDQTCHQTPVTKWWLAIDEGGFVVKMKYWYDLKTWSYSGNLMTSYSHDLAAWKDITSMRIIINKNETHFWEIWNLVNVHVWIYQTFSHIVISQHLLWCHSSTYYDVTAHMIS